MFSIPYASYICCTHAACVSFRGLARLVQDMIFLVPQLIVEITKIFTLEAGDLILTGTPEGVGPIQVDPDRMAFGWVAFSVDFLRLF